jgi:hypothetical protein
LGFRRVRTVAKNTYSFRDARASVGKYQRGYAIGRIAMKFDTEDFMKI